MKDLKTYGFGFNPEETNHHFLLKLTKGNAKIEVYEMFDWQENIEDIELNDKNLKILLNKTKWNKVKPVIKKEFNVRLKELGLKKSSFKDRLNDRYVPFERLLGKELMLLLWAIEDIDISMIDTAVKNWQGLSPEERWWLFSLTNASTGNYKDKRGWRIALRYAFTENPVDDDLSGSYVSGLF